MTENTKVIGIDLGTTNSVGAYYDGKNVRTLSPQASGLVPSQVFFDKDRGQLLVGQAAADMAYLDPENVILSIKRLMGWSWGEKEGDKKIEQLRKIVNYSIVHASDSEDSGVRVLMGGKEYTPVDISAMILKQIKQDAEKVLGKVTHAVITVPAYFSERQRSATIKAGQQAGLVVKKIIDEPSAAAIAYGFSVSKGPRSTLLVFDLGGGTFDVSVIITATDPNGKNHFHVVRTSGDNWLGGDDFDRKIVAEIVRWTQEKYKVDPSADKTFQWLAKQAAEKAKVALSSATETPVLLPAAYVHNGTPLNIRFNLSREQFSHLIQPDLDHCMEEVEKVLEERGMDRNQIEFVLMVGGSTLVPAVYNAVERYFGKEKVRQDAAPFHSVAHGAAILAAKLKGVQCPNHECLRLNDEAAQHCQNCGASLAAAVAVGDISIGEKTAKAFGIRAVGDSRAPVYEVIIPVGEPYPLQEPKCKIFEMTADNSIVIPVYEGLDKEPEWQGDIKISEDEFRKESLSVKVGTRVRVSMNFTKDRVTTVRVQVMGTKIDREVELSRDKAPRQEGGAVGVENPASELEFLIRIRRATRHCG